MYLEKRKKESIPFDCMRDEIDSNKREKADRVKAEIERKRKRSDIGFR